MNLCSRLRSPPVLSPAETKDYLTGNISFQMDEKMRKGLELYFELAQKHGLTERTKPLEFISYS